VNVPGSGQEASGLSIAGVTPLSTCDWPGRLVATVFCQGCPWRCAYCHNVELQEAIAPAHVAWARVLDLLRQRRGLLDGVVFSGGEPLQQQALPQAATDVHDLGFGVGLHTSGAFPRRLARVLPFVDWVGLDIKALPDAYASITGVDASAEAAMASLRLVLAAGVEHEARVTIDPAVHTRNHLAELVARLRADGVRHIALQEARTQGVRPDHAVKLGSGTLAELLPALPEGVVVRRAS